MYNKLVLCVLIAFAFCASGKPTRDTRDFPLNLEDASAVTSVLIDIDNPKDADVLKSFNVTPEEIRRKNPKTNGAANAGFGSTTIPFLNPKLDNARESRREVIRNRIETAFQRKDLENDGDGVRTEHEIAAYPVCTATEFTENSWRNDNNQTFKFASNVFESMKHLELDSATLRLFKINTNQTLSDTKIASHPDPCGNNIVVDSQIRLTVSLVLRKNKRSTERRKRICNTMMVNASHTGWVEIDVKRAIHLWENAEQHQQQHSNGANSSNNRLGIMTGYLVIELHDEEERPLKPGMYFEPPKCAQADFAIPWNFYRTYPAMPFLEKMPRSPRLDVKFVGGMNSAFPHRQPRPVYNLSRDAYMFSSNSAEATSSTEITPTDNLLEFSPSSEVKSHKRRHTRHHHHHHDHSENKRGTRSVEANGKGCSPKAKGC